MSRSFRVWSLALLLCCSGGACSHSEAPQVSAEELDDLTVDMMGRLKDPDPRARVVAAQFLAGRGDKAKEALPQLRELTKDKNTQVSAAAKTAVERLEGNGQSAK
jgi:HEAT repeat protein